jgi:hypothetical protein
VLRGVASAGSDQRHILPGRQRMNDAHVLNAGETLRVIAEPRLVAGVEVSLYAPRSVGIPTAFAERTGEAS